MLENIAQQIQQVREVANTHGIKESLDKLDPFTIIGGIVLISVAAYGWYKGICYGELGEKIRSHFQKKKKQREERKSPSKYSSIDELRDLYIKPHVFIGETVWDPEQSKYRIV